MYRTGKLVDGRAIVFVLYPLIIYVASTTLLLTVEATLPSRSDIEEAEKIVGNFLREEAGTKWLSGLAKTRSAPLTTQDLMNEILGATRPGGKVWKAASVLNESLKDQALRGVTNESILGQAESWKDVIAHIEDQDDIICLYRKNSEETSKKADDWKKFLRSVSPGYTVHIAIDTGRKYVICLKKIDVQESTTEEVSTTRETPKTVGVSVDYSTATTEIELSTTPEELETTSTLGISENTSNDNSNYNRNDDKLRDEPDYVDDDCDGDDSDDGEKDYNGYNDVNNDDNRYAETKDTNDEESERKMEDDLRAEFVEYPTRPGKRWDRHSPTSIDRRQLRLGNDGRPWIKFPARISKGLGSKFSKDSECSRPIVLMVRNEEVPSVYRPGSPSRNRQRNFGPIKLPRFRPPPQFEPARAPKLPSTAQQYPMNFFRIPRLPSNPPTPSNNFPQFTRPKNLGKPLMNFQTTVYRAGRQPIFSHNAHTVYKIPREKMRPSIYEYSTKSDVNPDVRPVAMSMTKPTLPTNRNPSVPRPIDFRSRGSLSYQRKPDYVNGPSYPFANYVPRSVGLSARNTLNPFIRRPIGNPSSIVSAKNDSFPRRITLGEINSIDRNVRARSAQLGKDYRVRQFLQNGNSRPQLRATVFRSGPKFVDQKSVELPNTVQHLPTFLNLANSAQSSVAITDRKIFEQRSPLPFRDIDRNKQRTRILRRNPQAENLYRHSYGNFHSNYPKIKNVVQPDNVIPEQIGSPFSSRPCPVPLKVVLDASAQKMATCGNPSVCGLLGGHRLKNNARPCPSPCDRPIKLQIVINGNVQEPLKVSVINESEQRVEIVGSDEPKMSHGSRALGEGTSLKGDPKDDEKNNPTMVADVEERMLGSKENNDEPVDDKSLAKEKGEEAEKKEEEVTNEKVTSVESTSDESNKLDDEYKSTTTTDGPKNEETEGPEVEERFLHERIPETTSEDVVTDVNTTSTSVTNSTIVEEMVV